MGKTKLQKNKYLQTTLWLHVELDIISSSCALCARNLTSNAFSCWKVGHHLVILSSFRAQNDQFRYTIFCHTFISYKRETCNSSMVLYGAECNCEDNAAWCVVIPITMQSAALPRCRGGYSHRLDNFQDFTMPDLIFGLFWWFWPCVPSFWKFNQD